MSDASENPKGYRFPKRVVTDELRSYSVAIRETPELGYALHALV